MKDIEKLMISLELKKPWNKDLKTFEIKKLYKTTLKLIKYAKETKDLRFFNTSLKINDFLRNNKKVFSEKKIKRLNELEKNTLDWVKDLIL